MREVDQMLVSLNSFGRSYKFLCFLAAEALSKPGEIIFVLSDVWSLSEEHLNAVSKWKRDQQEYNCDEDIEIGRVDVVLHFLDSNAFFLKKLKVGIVSGENDDHVLYFFKAEQDKIS